MSPALEIADLRLRHADGTEALRGVDLSLAEGSCTALLGANGAGKTSLVLALAGLLRPSQGSARLFGETVDWRRPAALRRAIGFTFVDPDDQLFMPTVREDVCFGPLCRGGDPETVGAEAEALLAELGIAGLAGRFPGHCSAGEKRLAALAAVLISRPQILICDEPTAFLDPAARAELIARLAQLPGTRLIVTHDLELAAALCDRCAIMDAGRIAAVAQSAELLADHRLLARHHLRAGVRCA